MKPAKRKFLLGSAALAGACALDTAIGQDKSTLPPGLRVRSKREVGYRDEPYIGRNCARCVLYQGDGKCVILSEPVSPNGWCTQWVPNTMG